MTIYHLERAADNPLFEGLALEDGQDILQSWPSNWRMIYERWTPLPLGPTWTTPHVIGRVRRLNDYPCINGTFPAFSTRAVDQLRDLLEPNGELLPVAHETGIYYFFNCTRLAACVDLDKSKKRKVENALITDVNGLIFKEEALEGLTIFKIRSDVGRVFCTQRFVDRVTSAGLYGFLFVPVWPLPPGITYYSEMRRLHDIANKWRLPDSPALEIKGNAVVLRLYCTRKKASKQEMAAADQIMNQLEAELYRPDQGTSESYYGDVEGLDPVDGELRVFITSPDCDRLIGHLMPTLKTLSWPGRFDVVKRRGVFDDIAASEEYVRLITE